MFKIAFISVCFFITAQNYAVAASNTNSDTVTISSISLPEHSDKTLQFAAGELSKYFNLMTQREYPIKDSNGGADNSALLKIDKNLQHDGYNIFQDGSSVCITGGSSRGCLYGAYTLLQKLGCSFPLPGKDNEVIPTVEKIRWNSLPIQSEPAIKHRGLMLAISTYTDDILETIDFMAKNRFNFIIFHGGRVPDEFVPKLKETLEVRDMGFEWGGHFLPGYLPRNLFKEHPEYFRMENGKRTDALNMCPSSPEAAEIIAKNSPKDWANIRDISRFEMLHNWPDDLFDGGWCSCDKCKNLSFSDQSLKIVNEVAKRLPLKSETSMAHGSYHATLGCPTTIRPNHNVRLFFAPRERCYHHNITGCETNRRYYDFLRKQINWFPNDPEVMEYYNDCVLFRQLPMPLYSVIGDDVKLYRELGINRITSLTFQTYSEWAYGPNYYVLGKSLWRGQGDKDDIKEYLNAVYGPSAETMKEYFDLLFELCSTAMETCEYKGFADLRWPTLENFTVKHIAQLAPLVTDENLDKLQSLINAAFSGAKEPYRARIANQLILYKIARLDTSAIYNTMLTLYLDNKGVKSDAERLYIIAIARQAAENIDEAAAILLSAPAEFRGPTVFKNGGMIAERFGYKSILLPREKKYIQELQDPNLKNVVGQP